MRETHVKSGASEVDQSNIGAVGHAIGRRVPDQQKLLLLVTIVINEAENTTLGH